MAIELITGHSGEAHVSGDDVGRLLMGVVGKGKVMLGSAPSVTMTDANTCSIGACDFLLDGRHVRLTGSSVVSIANGATGSKRSDLVVARYAASASTGVESVTLEVIQGAAGSSATDPDLEYPASIADGATTADYPIVRVTLDGLNPTAKWLVAETLSLTDVVDRIGGIAGRVSALESKTSPLSVANGGTGANNAKSARANLGIPIYEKGSTVTGDATVAGFLTNGGKNIQFDLPLQYPIANDVNGRKLTSLKVIIRAVNGTYLNPSGANADEMVGRSGYTTTVAGTWHHPEVTIEKSSAWGSVTNNTPVAVRVYSFSLNLT